MVRDVPFQQSRHVLAYRLVLAVGASDLETWRDLRGTLERRQAVRTLGRRFRSDPVAYLKLLEDPLINQALPLSPFF